mgnify:CR=1 FL=1
MQRYEKEKCEELLAHQSSSKIYQFDYFFEKSQQEKSDFNVLCVSDSDSNEDDEDDDDDLVEEEEEKEEVPDKAIEASDNTGESAIKLEEHKEWI